MRGEAVFFAAVRPEPDELFAEVLVDPEGFFGAVFAVFLLAVPEAAAFFAGPVDGDFALPVVALFAFPDDEVLPFTEAELAELLPLDFFAAEVLVADFADEVLAGALPPEDLAASVFFEAVFVPVTFFNALGLWAAFAPVFELSTKYSGSDFEAFALWPLIFVGEVSFFFTVPFVLPCEVFHSTVSPFLSCFAIRSSWVHY